ncbi:uncharacterized protein TNCT_594521 [Trichonephila clavata]|uniref:Uncharacterized protein n=1 Tax=Trichonephila clavata TaxID=2740835 RepID=A0A8X6IHV5_TRICU|nr:uncharacterized protein TNCT_594521 [Trichonephila clavata]
MVIVAYDVRGVIVFHFVPHGTTVTARYYSDFLLRQARRGVRILWTVQDHIKQSVYGSYSDVEDGKNWSIYHTLPTFPPVTLVSFKRLRNQYMEGGLQHERTLLILCANRRPDSHMVRQMLRLMVFSTSYIVGSAW